MPNLPNLPLTFSVPYVLPVGGTTWQVHSGDNLQNILDAAQLGDVIILDAGATFTGNYKLPVKGGSGWLYIISSNLASLPTEGNRVSPSDAVNMPCIQATTTANRPALAFFKNANHYRFVGIEIKNATTISNFNVIISGYGGDYTQPSYTWTAVTSDSDLPSYIVFDRCYIHNTTVYPIACRCGFIMNGHYMAVVDSYFKNFIDTSDAQAINIIQGTGPYKIVNNYLEASGENFLIGGTDPSIPNANAEDVEFRGNYLYKDHTAWSTHWTIKNLFELKNGHRVLCTGNVMENVYSDQQGQSATAIVLTVRNQSGNNTGAQLQDITVTNNRIHTCGRAWRLTGFDDIHTSLQTQRVLIENNAWDDVNQAYTSQTTDAQISTTTAGPAIDVTIRHNLALANTDGKQQYMFLMLGNTGFKTAKNLTVENNLWCHGDFGLYGGSIGTGNIVLTTWADTFSWQKNVYINRTVDRDYTFWSTHSYPSTGGNVMTNGIASVGFTDYTNANYELLASSPFHNLGTDGKDIGPDWTVLSAAIANVKTGQAAPPIPPTPPPAPQNFIVVSSI